MVVVRRIFKLLAVDGLTLGEVVRQLNSEAIPSPMVGKTHADISGEWHVPTVSSLVKNLLYRPLAVEEIAASTLVSPEVARCLDSEKPYGLWTWNKRHQRMRRERGEDGVYRDRYQMVPKPKEEWLAVPISLSDAGLSRAHVDAARERIGQNQGRRPPSTAAERYWQLSGGIVRCAECGSVLSPRVRRRKLPRETKTDFWYLCRQKYNYGPRDCTSGRSVRAPELEEAVWQAVLGIISDPHRLLRQYEEHMERQKREMRGDPDREARSLLAELEKLKRRRSGLLNLVADGDMTREQLRAKLAEVDEEATGCRRPCGRRKSARMPSDSRRSTTHTSTACFSR